MRSRLLLATVLLFVTSVIQPDVSTAVTPAGGRVMLTASLRGLDTRDGGSRTTGPIGLAGLGACGSRTPCSRERRRSIRAPTPRGRTRA